MKIYPASDDIVFIHTCDMYHFGPISFAVFLHTVKQMWLLVILLYCKDFINYKKLPRVTFNTYHFTVPTSSSTLLLNIKVNFKKKI